MASSLNLKSIIQIYISNAQYHSQIMVKISISKSREKKLKKKNSQTHFSVIL